MGFKLWCCAVLLVSYVLSTLIEFGFFAIVYNHLPGKCTRFNMSGSEDLVLFPNNHVLISSGIFIHNSWVHKSITVPSGVFLLDLNLDSPQPVNLTFEGYFESQDEAVFHPHGMGHWVDKNGSMYLYIVNHREDADTIESFEYKPSAKKLVYRKTFRDPRFHNINDLVLVDMDKFYATVDHYFTNPVLIVLETHLRLSLAYVLYFDGRDTIVASDGVKYPNGIAKSNDGRFIFVNEVLRGQVIAYTRNQDHTLQQVQVLPLQVANDNIHVDPKTGHLWVGILVHPLKVSDYFKDRSVPVASKCLHVSIDPDAALPFSSYSVEEVLSSTGEDGVVGAVTLCVYSEGRIVVGTIGKDMMLCDAPYLMYD